jgi:V/A-type H+-transporting ATPase subunit D
MKQKVVATRMELLRVRKRLDLAVRGHKLLKDKLEGLIRELTDRLEHYKELRVKVDREWPELFQRFLLAEAESPSGAIEDALLQARPTLKITSKITRVMGVMALETEAEITSPGGAYSLMQTSPQLDEALSELRGFLPDLIRLAGLEQAVRALAEEINKTRRRANALEYVLIPDLREARRTIVNRLEEIARSDTSRLMKVKEMLLEREEEDALT